MRHSFKKSAWCVIDTPTPHPFATLYLLSRSSNLVLLPSGDAGGSTPLFGQDRYVLLNRAWFSGSWVLNRVFHFLFLEGLKWANYRRISGRRFSPSGNTSAVRRLGGTPLPELTSSAPREFHLRSTGRLNKTCNLNRRRVSSFDQGLAWRAKDTSSIPGTASIFTFGIDITKENVLSLPCKQLTLYFAREHIEEVIPSPQVNAKSVYVRDNLKTYFSICRWRLFFHRLFIFNFSGGRRGGRGLKKGNKIKITRQLIDKNVSLKIVRIVFLLGVSAS